jgi:hypothetical protein
MTTTNPTTMNLTTTNADGAGTAPSRSMSQRPSSMFGHRGDVGWS